MIPTSKLYIAAVIAQSTLDRIRRRALSQEPISVDDVMGIDEAIERLEAARKDYRRAEPDLSVWEAALEDVEMGDF